MKDFLSNIKRDLAAVSSEHIMITLVRKDVEQLIKSYERIKKENAKNGIS